MAKLLVQTSGALLELATLAASAGAGSSGGVPHLDASGKLSPTFDPNITCRVTADQAFTATALATVTQLTLPVVSGVCYAFRFLVLFQTAATTTGISLALNGPTFTAFSYNVLIPIAVASFLIGCKQTYASATIGTAVAAANTTYVATIDGVLIPSASGNLIVQAATEVAASAATVKVGSVGILETVV
jgi:hypothetical protein